MEDLAPAGIEIGDDQEEEEPRQTEAEEETAMADLVFPRHENPEFVERCGHVPLRLSEEERQKLGTLMAALKVSEYTDEVDTMSRRHKSARIADGLEDLARISTGLAVCAAPHKAKAVTTMKGKAFFFREIFEIGRRHKIMNPEKMRSEYGKLMYVLQDAQSRVGKETLGFSCHSKLKMVTGFLEVKKAMNFLWDARLPVACGKNIEEKARARSDLATAWSPCLTPLEVQLVIDSIDDARCYEEFNVAPVDAMLKHLEESFDPRCPTPEKPVSLSLRRSDQGPPQWPISSSSGGEKMTSSDDASDASSDDILSDDDSEEDDRYKRGGGFSRLASSLGGGISRFAVGMRDNLAGAKLSHDHATQYTYVRQSLLLWREIMKNMYRLWADADADLLTSTQGAYQLWNTGQGLNRVQQCPRVAASMRRHLCEAQRTSGKGWVGLSVVHLGDRDVPNALIFIDKYTQVPRILSPIAQVLEAIPKLCENDPALKAYVQDKWGGLKELHLAILSDFFKRAFDGDGDDGGSCIDGRLTSAWNFCSKIAKKDYYAIFNMAGFEGFDGNYRDD